MIGVNKRVREHEPTLRGIEVIVITLWIVFASISVHQINKQIRQVNTQITQNNKSISLLEEQNNLQDLAIKKAKRFEEIKLLNEVSKSFEEEPYTSMLEDFRTKNPDLKDKYSPLQVKNLLNKFEYLARLWEENEFKENDIRVNFARAIEIICETKYLVWENWIINQQGWYWWVKKLCQKRWE